MTVEDPGRAPGRIAFLDYLRIFAFLSVLAGHQFYPHLAATAADPGVHATLRALASMLMPLCWGGGAGVVVFFLVSGYIITHVLGSEDARTFAIKRIFRIYPLFWLAVVLEAVVGHFASGTPWPPLSTWIPRLLLVGDFFGTPYALKNVEWTLRIEILFYAAMLLAKASLFPKRVHWLPALFAAAALLLQWIGPFPDFVAWSKGMVTLYLPLLFVGANVYLAERRLAPVSHAVASSAFILAVYLWSTPFVNPIGIGSNFMAYGVGLFLLAWVLRDRLGDPAAVRFLAGLTYSVYLFHHWSWDYLERLVRPLGIAAAPVEWQVLAVLLALCALLHYTAERWGIRLGARLAGTRRRAPPVDRA